MFPFNLPGPQFLLFYAIFGALVLIVLRRSQRSAEGGDVPKLSFDDPLAIAYLRGGAAEAIRVAAANLVDRDLLSLDGTRVVAAAKGDPAFVRRPLESALLERARLPVEAESLAEDPILVRAADKYAQDLERRGLLPNADQAAARRRRYLVALAVLWLVAALKIAIAVAAGRRNIVFLLIFAGIAALPGLAWLRRRRTALGDRLLDDLRRLFARLRTRHPTMRPGSASADALMLTSVFGIASLPPTYPARNVFTKRDSSSSSSSCGSGSSCSSSGGDGGGGGCGGGGGGCGGCGGE